MKTKGILAGLIVCFLALTWSIQPADAATQLKKLGGHPFYKAKGLQAEKVIPVLIRLKGDVKRGFVKAGAAELYEPFMEQLKTAKLEAVDIRPGEGLKWMIYKKKGKVAVSRDLVWSGKAPFQAYRMVVRHNDRDYEFIMPKICLNISLKEVAEVPKGDGAAAFAEGRTQRCTSSKRTGSKIPEAAPPTPTPSRLLRHSRREDRIPENPRPRPRKDLLSQILLL